MQWQGLYLNVLSGNLQRISEDLADIMQQVLEHAGFRDLCLILQNVIEVERPAEHKFRAATACPHRRMLESVIDLQEGRR